MYETAAASITAFHVSFTLFMNIESERAPQLTFSIFGMYSHISSFALISLHSDKKGNFLSSNFRRFSPKNINCFINR